MKNILLSNVKKPVSEISLGCMRIGSKSVFEVEGLLDSAIENGINFFDHADIYGAGKSEILFGQAFKHKREDIIIQTKCGIRKGYFDFSKKHIMNSVENSLKNLNTDYIDILLLHRPDALIEPEEVSETFNILREQGKVKHFGVSNHNAMQISLLNKFLEEKLIINQIQYSLAFSGIVDSGLTVNMKHENSINRDDSILDFCRLNDITIQAWSPFQHGTFEGTFLNNDKYKELNTVIDRLATEKNVTANAIAIKWILRHPAKIQPVVGTTNPTHLKEICKASDIDLTREEWYELYRSAGNILP